MTIRLDDFYINYGDQKYYEVGVFLDLLRSLYFFHQTAHWQTFGKDSYSDHLLFQRLYEGILPEIDLIGEKLVGLGDRSLVNLDHSLTNMPIFLRALNDQTNIEDTVATQLVKKALLAEKSFLAAGERIMNALKSKNLLTRGLEQTLGTILDTHETHVYLLKQRITLE